MLDLINVTKFYKKNRAVNDLSFHLEPGEIFALVGANGAGKSTTVSMIATLMKPDQGKILFYGEDVAAHPQKIRSRMGYVPQDIALYETLNGYDNLEFWGKSYHVGAGDFRDSVSRVCSMIGFSDAMLKKKVKDYSGGMKRRLNIAVALLHRPELVILDEPTAGIDLLSRNQILSAIKELSREGTGIVYVGHYLEEVERICDRVCIMSAGSGILNLPMDQALKRPEGRISLEKLYAELIKQ